MGEAMDLTNLPYIVEPMQLEDIPEVIEIERVAFPSPWPSRAYRYEVTQNRLAHYFVARRQFPEELKEGSQAEESTTLLQRVQLWTQGSRARERSVVGYCGFWIAADEAHISTIAVDPSHRRRGVGQLLLVTAIDHAVELKANVVSLEVRVSNPPAQNLYHKYGFKVVGRRPRYYSDNREDALIMTATYIAGAPYQRMLNNRREQLIQRLSKIPLPTSQT